MCQWSWSIENPSCYKSTRLEHVARRTSERKRAKWEKPKWSNSQFERKMATGKSSSAKETVELSVQLERGLS